MASKEIDSIDLLTDDSVSRSSRTLVSLRRSFNKAAECVRGNLHHDINESLEYDFLPKQRIAPIPFKGAESARTGKECCICLVVSAVLLFILAGMFGFVYLLARHPGKPSLSLQKVSGGTLFLYTDVNNTILVSSMNLTIVSSNPNAKAEIFFKRSMLDFSFQGRSVGKFVTPAFRQASDKKNQAFIAVVNSTRSFEDQRLVKSIRSQFEQQNVTLSIAGSIPLEIKVARIVSSHSAVQFNCSVSFTPSFPPVILWHSCSNDV